MKTDVLEIRHHLGLLELKLRSLVDVPVFRPDVLPALGNIADDLRELSAGIGIAALRHQYLKSCAVVAEIAMHLGQDQMARSPLESGRSVIDGLVGATVTARDPKTTREEVRFAVDFAFGVLHRDGNSDRAIAVLNQCVDIANRLATSDFPCFGTRGHALLHRAIILRDGGREDRALQDLHQALELYASKARHYRNRDDGSDSKAADPQQGLHWLRHRAVQVLLELGWAYYRQGRLARASDCISSAELMQIHAETGFQVDDITNAHTNLLRVAVQRSSDGRSNPQRLRESLMSLGQAERTFRAFEHQRGVIRSQYEHAMTYRYLPDSSDEACRRFEDVRRLALQAAEVDKRWACYAESQLSQLSGSRDDAISFAGQALNRATQRGLRPCQIDALFARAEGYLRSPANPGRARADLLRVMDYETAKGGANLRIGVRCELLLARAFIQEAEGDKAEHCIQRARKLIEKVENTSLRDLLRVVQAERDEIEVDHDFRLVSSDRHEYPQYVQHLQRWLVAQARRRFGTDRDVANAIGISRMTLYNWERSLKVDDPKPKTKAKRRGD